MCLLRYTATTSSAGRKLKVGARTSGEKRRKNFLCHSTFFGSINTISRFGECFRDGQYSFRQFALLAVLLLTVLLRTAICKVGDTYLPCPVESAPVLQHSIHPTW